MKAIGKVFSTVLVLAMVIGLFSTVTFALNDGTELPPLNVDGSLEKDTITVHAIVPSDWAEAYCYVWADGNDSIKMQKSGTEYICEIPNTNRKIIIKNALGWDQQTVDLKIDNTKSEVWVYLTNQDSEGKYNAVVTNNAPITVHAHVPANWSNVHCWAWNSVNGAKVSQTWPGKAMELVGNDWYTCTVPGWVDRVIINFGEGGAKTQDISIDSGKSHVWLDTAANISGFNDNPTPEYLSVVSCQATLTDRIGLNYRFHIPANVNAQIRFTVGNQTASAAENIIEGNAVCHVVAKQMADNIKAEVLVNNEVVLTDHYSVQQYLESLLSNPDAKIAEMARAMLNYGAAAQKYFGYNTANLANRNVSNQDPIANKDTFTSNSSITGTVSGLSYYGHNLNLNSATSLKHFFKLQEGADLKNYTFEANGSAVEAKIDAKGFVVVEIANIYVADLNQSITLTVTNKADSSSATIVYGPYDYAKQACEQTKPELVNLMLAMADYHNAAAALLTH